MSEPITAFEAEVTQGKQLNEEQLRFFNKNGYIILNGLLDSDEIERIKSVRDRAEEKARTRGATFKEGGAFWDMEPLPGGDESNPQFGLRKVQEAFIVEDDFREVVSSDKILDVVEDLIGPNIYYHSSKLMCKPANGGRRKAWHQDFAYWAKMQPKQVTVWIAIDKSTRLNGCMKVIAGSHKRGLIPHHQGEDYMIDESSVTNDDIIYAEMDPGDVLFFNVLTLHASDPNNSDKPRLAAIVDYDSQPTPEDFHFGWKEPMRTAG